MKKINLLTIIFLFVVANINAQQKEHVISHNGETIVTDPSKGRNSYKRWAKFPEKTKNGKKNKQSKLVTINDSS